ncbi:hypothetical protein ACLB90_10770 [Stenotrophomonas sp. LGBM10]|uniref:hypothetical protein n=1 Tax=Stenotrophomonas sp. LGBM10 TaxID=3390038 RepID=UPI00398AB09E
MESGANLVLNLWHKRQATLLCRFASLPYLKGLLEQINQLIGFSWPAYDSRLGRDNVVNDEPGALRDTRNSFQIDTTGV